MGRGLWRVRAFGGIEPLHPLQPHGHGSLWRWHPLQEADKRLEDPLQMLSALVPLRSEFSLWRRRIKGKDSASCPNICRAMHK